MKIVSLMYMILAVGSSGSALAVDPDHPAANWIPLANGAAVDYASIRLDGVAPTMLVKHESKEPRKAGPYLYTTILIRYSVDCAAGLLRVEHIGFLDGARRLLADGDRNLYRRVMGENPGFDDVPLTHWKSLCIWRENGFALPDLGTEEQWEDMASPPNLKIQEAPAKRQLRNGIALLKQRNVNSPPVTVFEQASEIAVFVTVYDCRTTEAHVALMARYDLQRRPIAVRFYTDEPYTPKLEENRKRLASACARG